MTSEDKTPLEVLEDWYEAVPRFVNEDFQEILDLFKQRGVSWND